MEKNGNSEGIVAITTIRTTPTPTTNTNNNNDYSKYNYRYNEKNIIIKTIKITWITSDLFLTIKYSRVLSSALRLLS